MADFIMNFLNLDSKLFKTLTKIFIPAQLSIEFMQGKRKSFVNPARLFLLSLIVHISFLVYFQNHYAEEIGSEFLFIQQNKSEMLLKFDTIRPKFDAQNLAAIDSIREHLFEGVVPAGQDTLDLSEINIHFLNLSEYKFVQDDIMNMEIDELIQHYEVEGFLDQLVVRQGVRVMKDLKGTINFIIGNLIWVVILSILVLVVGMKFLYIRRAYYYIEHLVFQFHVHTFFFLTLTIGGIMDLGFHTDSIFFTSIAFCISILYYFISMKRYYKQGWIKTIVKYSILGILYMVVITVCLLIVGTLSVFLF